MKEKNIIHRFNFPPEEYDTDLEIYVSLSGGSGGLSIVKPMTLFFFLFSFVLEVLKMNNDSFLLQIVKVFIVSLYKPSLC